MGNQDSLKKEEVRGFLQGWRGVYNSGGGGFSRLEGQVKDYDGRFKDCLPTMMNYLYKMNNNAGTRLFDFGEQDIENILEKIISQEVS